MRTKWKIKNEGTSTQQSIWEHIPCPQVTERAVPVVRELTVLREELEVLFKNKRRASYPDQMSAEYEEPEKVSWRQEHHLKDEEASINTTHKYKGVVSGSRDWSVRPESQTCSCNNWDMTLSKPSALFSFHFFLICDTGWLDYVSLP